MTKYIIFRAEGGQPWKGREFAHTGGCTRTIAENFYSDSETPKVGDRVTKFDPFKETDPNSPPCHPEYKSGDWEVIRVEEYTPEIPGETVTEFDSIYICYCKYSPINTSADTMQSAELATVG